MIVVLKVSFLYFPSPTPINFVWCEANGATTQPLLVPSLVLVRFNWLWDWNLDLLLFLDFWRIGGDYRFSVCVMKLVTLGAVDVLTLHLFLSFSPRMTAFQAFESYHSPFSFKSNSKISHISLVDSLLS